ncbi:MAG: GGDEF domain-containing protein [Gemmatimonadaceae bacterium]
MLRFHRYLRARRATQLLAVAFLAGGAFGILDYATGWVLSFAAFYLIPVAICAGYVSRRAGMVAAVLSTVTWAVANRLAGELTPLPIAVWNATTRLLFFGSFAWLLSELRSAMEQLGAALERERELSRVDPLTGIQNAQGFREVATHELRRAARYRRDVGIVFLDLDDFKRVNDTWGHATGDEVLREVATLLAGNLRQSDTVARMGGDEFAILLPETDEPAARVIVEKLQRRLLERFTARQWPVSVSVGAVVAHAPNQSVDQLLQAADGLMYGVKRRGKNGVAVECID